MSTLTLSLDGPLVILESFLQALDLGRRDRVRIHGEGQRIIVEPEVGESTNAKLARSERTGRLMLTQGRRVAPVTMEMVKNILDEIP